MIKLSEVLASLEVGECHYLETTYKDYQKDMRKLHPSSARRPKVLEGRVFVTSMLTAVGTSIGDIQYLIRIYRQT